MSLVKNAHVIIFGGIPDEHRGRALGPYRIRTVVENTGHSASLIDYFWGKSPDQIIRHISYCIGPNTIIFGVSYTWVRDLMRENPLRGNVSENLKEPTIDELLKLIFLWLKNNHPQIQIVIGSANSTTINRNILDMVDWIVDGFAELSLPALIDHLIFGEQLQYSVRTGIKYIDSNIDYKITNVDKLEVRYKSSDDFLSHQPLTLETCRGCLWNCAYCQYAFRGKKDYDYIRSAEHIAVELRQNYEMFGTTRYMIADDTFNDSEEKIIRVLKAVELAKLPDFKYVCYLRPEMLVNRPAMIPLLIELGLSGAHLGIESFNNESRKLMGRSGDILKIKDQLCLLKSTSKHHIGLLGSFIIGLPYDCVDDIISWNENLCREQGQFLDQWWWSPLQINSNPGEKISFNNKTISSPSNQSLIEKNPDKYGYTLTGADNEISWSNKFMTLSDANKLLKKLYNINRNYIGFGGWSVAFAWYFNLSDAQIKSSKLFDYDFKAEGLKMCDRRFQYWDNYILGNNSVQGIV